MATHKATRKEKQRKEKRKEQVFFSFLHDVVCDQYIIDCKHIIISHID